MAAELGTAKEVGIKDLQPGMKVHKDVYGYRGKTLVSAGEVLTRKHCDKLMKWENQPKPEGPVLAKKDIKNKMEPIRKGEWQGGWRPSDFNPRGVLVSATLASGADVPAVENDPSLSPLLKKRSDGSQPVMTAPDVGVESPLFRCRVLETEIKTLEKMNAQLGGSLHTVDTKPCSEDELTVRRDTLSAQNDYLITEIKDAKPRIGRPPKQKPEQAAA